MLQRVTRHLPRMLPNLDNDDDQNPGALVNALGYLTALAGYIFTLLATSRLSLPVFLLFTVANILWFACFIPLTSFSENWTANQVHLALLGLSVATFWACALIFAGLSLDWLLPVVTIAVLMLVYPPRAAIISGGIIALGILALLLVASLSSGRALSSIMQDMITLTPAFLYAFTFPFFMRQQLQQRKRAEALVAQLETAQEQLRAHADQVEELAVSRERNRMAREIHDTLGHYLTILAVQLETALKLEEHGDPRLHHELVEARRAAAECLTEVRQSVSALRPTDLTRSTLSEALARLTHEFESALPETEIVLDAEGDSDHLPPELRLTLYRCAQEALTNVRKHARATKALVRLRIGCGDDDRQQAELTVLDNGRLRADTLQEAPSGFGLQGIRERIALANGRISAGPEPGGGWRVEITVPIPSTAMHPGALVASGGASATRGDQ